MATNTPLIDGRHESTVRYQSQVFNPHHYPWIKSDTETGRFMNVKVDLKLFKGFRKEK